MMSCVMQVSRQLASKCAELVQCQTELHQVHHMLAAAYAANAALQVRFRQASQPSPAPKWTSLNALALISMQLQEACAVDAVF